MAFFQAQASRARHEYFDQTMAEATTMLHDPAVVVSLGQAAVDFYQHLFDCYFVPDVKHNIVKLPETGPHAEEGIPVIPIRERNNFVIPRRKTIFHPLQRTAINNNLRALGLTPEEAQIEASQITAMRLESQAYLGLGRKVLGETGSVIAQPSIKQENSPQPIAVQVYGAPHVILNMNSRTSNFEEALTLLHETQHVTQYMGKPVVKVDEELRRIPYRYELEARFIESRIQSVLYTRSDNPKYKNADALKRSTALSLDQEREKLTAHIGDKFYPTDELMKFMQDEGYLVVTV